MHRVQGVVCTDAGREEVRGDDSEMLTYWRSAMKPFQAIPLMEDGVLEAYGFGPEHLALCCASHGGMRNHTARVAAMLRTVGLAEENLHCGPHAPFDSDTAQVLHCSGRLPTRLHNNCSGKHAGMLALARHHGWAIEGYHRLDHPVQMRIRRCLKDWLDFELGDHHWAMDGCGVPTPRMPLHEMARAYSRLVQRARGGHAAAGAVVGAMTAHPELTSSRGRIPLRIMEATKGRLLAKEGAEGVLCVAAVDDDWGLALKVEDGAMRAVGPAAVQVLDSLGLLRDEEHAALDPVRAVHLENTLGERVGTVSARPSSEGSKKC